MQAIRFPQVDFSSQLVSDLIELERVRLDFRTEALDDPFILELRRLFQGLTSMMSARIEGNRTTVSDVVAEARRAKITGDQAVDAVREILQLEEATEYIERLAAQGRLELSHVLVRDLHRMSVNGLEREGDPHPGSYRQGSVAIAGATHLPPGPNSVQPDMDQLLEFANREVQPQYQLLQVALVHHRFVWIHPFTNGNGRVSRLLTYAMLIKRGYTSRSTARPLNPTAVFGADRQAYYHHLAQADSLSDDSALAWCGYVIRGLRDDLASVTHLADRSYVVDQVFAEALNTAIAHGTLAQSDGDVLYEVARRGTSKAGELSEVIPGTLSSRSQKLGRLVKSGFLQKVGKPQKYAISLWQNDLTIHVVQRLDELGMLPSILRD
ncbi:Fic family protein [Kocuria sp. ZOR0020]|uniref:Fic family protein n=1 Tax=Kocuria sp. ZOR0020 TaxID=1339234 RepID=UPI00064641F9|nr:Fic family protein [Kocuria sp. ZOR0020]